MLISNLPMEWNMNDLPLWACPFSSNMNFTSGICLCHGLAIKHRNWEIWIIHYRALRTAVKDHRRLLPKKELNNIFQRATPSQWMKYSCCKLAINLYNLGDSGPPMSTLLKNSAYINDRQPERAYFIDSSRIKIGWHSFVNRLNSIRDVTFGWTQGINPNKLRIELKKTFINLWNNYSSYYSFQSLRWAYFLFLSSVFICLFCPRVTNPSLGHISLKKMLFCKFISCNSLESINIQIQIYFKSKYRFLHNLTSLIPKSNRK